MYYVKDHVIITLKLRTLAGCACVRVCVCVCVRVCVYVHPPWRLHLSGTSGTAREQINDVVIEDVGFFQLAALSCSYTGSGHSHDLTSIRLERTCSLRQDVLLAPFLNICDLVSSLLQQSWQCKETNLDIIGKTYAK